jgi:large subunit ribosomal protein L29
LKIRRRFGVLRERIAFAQEQRIQRNTGMTKARELHEMSDDQLRFTLEESQRELFRLRFQASTERLDAPSNVMKHRRDIARIKTIQRERVLQSKSMAGEPK